MMAKLINQLVMCYAKHLLNTLLQHVCSVQLQPNWQFFRFQPGSAQVLQGLQLHL